MKDEERKAKKEELKKKIDEMSDEELDKVAGGYIINNDDGTITLINDSTGENMGTYTYSQFENRTVENIIKTLNEKLNYDVSTKVITKKDYKEKFGKEFTN